MRKKIVFDWEVLDQFTRRVKVLGGWIVQCRIFDEAKKGGIITQSSVFVADRDHEWEIAQTFNPSDPGTLHPKVNPSDYEAPK